LVVLEELGVINNRFLHTSFVGGTLKRSGSVFYWCDSLPGSSISRGGWKRVLA